MDRTGNTKEPDEVIVIPRTGMVNYRNGMVRYRFCKLPAWIKGQMKCDRGQRMSEMDDWWSGNHKQIK